MAQTQYGDLVQINFTNSLRAVADAGGNTDDLTDPADYLTEAAMDSFLNTFDNQTYSTANLLKLNINDKVFAVRNIEDPTTIASYVQAQVSRTA